MKRSIILLLVLLPIVAFSQMQQIMNQNSTATLKRNTSYTIGGIYYDSIKIRNIDKENLVLSIPFSTSGTEFTLSMNNNGGKGAYIGLKVCDFKIFEDYIYFCGTYNGVGFIGWTKTHNMFSSSPNPAHIELINDPIIVKEVSELEVYELEEKIHIAAIADERFLIHLHRDTNTSYQIIESQYKFKTLSVGTKYISTIERIDSSTLIISSFYGGDIQQYTGSIFSHPDLTYDKYLLENLGSNIFALAYTHEAPTLHRTYKTDFAIYDASSGINIMNKQCLEVNNAKLRPIDLEFCKEDKNLLYLANGHYGYDEIFELDPFNQNSYTAKSVQPLPQSDLRTKQYNGLTRYDDYYYAAITKDTANGVVIFDCERNSSQSYGCATTFNQQVVITFHLNQILGLPFYTYIVGQKHKITRNITPTAINYNIICQ